jgi:hypothetical protein
MTIPAAPQAPRPAFADVTPAQWQALAGKRLYFGHQSVGGNIVDGVTAVLADHPEIPLHVVQAAALDSSAAPGLYHARIGRNGNPGSKAAAFNAIVDHGVPAVGILKFCYVDVEGRRNPDSLFAEYQRDMSALRARHPGLVIVHVTMPLTVTGEGRLDLLVQKVRGQASSFELNIIRNRYNALLRQAYVGKEPVFDLARLESTAADGSRVFFTSGADTVYTLAPGNTDDGGHLNAAARRAAAQEFLAVLAGL